MKNSEVLAILIAEHGRYCENCHYPKDGDRLDCHHVLVHNQKRYADILTNPINCCVVCRTCHQNGIVNGFEFRVRFLNRQISRGIDVLGWFSGLPEKLQLTNGWIREELK
jgi:hypothetical protein